MIYLEIEGFLSHPTWWPADKSYRFNLHRETRAMSISSKRYRSEKEPSIVDITKLRVRTGKDAVLQCIVENLGNYKVAWLRVKNQTLIAVHTKVILRSDRYSVSHQNLRIWKLKIEKVTLEDKGYYMCQVNTPVLKTKPAYLEVVVPPAFDSSSTSNSTDVMEYTENVTLICKATGNPLPVIKWCREDNRSFKVGDQEVKQYGGNSITFVSVTREYMGAYLCIATNNVPPSIRRRLYLEVKFPPTIWIPNQFVGAPLGSNRTLECYMESQPRAVSFWLRGEDYIHDKEDKYKTYMAQNTYKSHMKLTIINVQSIDYGLYICAAKNEIGKSEGSLTLYRTEQSTSLKSKHETKPNILPQTPDILIPQLEERNQLKDILKQAYPQNSKGVLASENRRHPGKDQLSGLQEHSHKNNGYTRNTDTGTLLVVHRLLTSFFLAVCIC
ncbi:lachesin-like [Limulus polyphemus]|uniref:Lachesin-like n=1 Tax=Limulus polyphemus TaxID=6850 RepID=A0ABM1S9Y3_LIMPO|nr:lachesin-like [Limulus polyphemus]